MIRWRLEMSRLAHEGCCFVGAEQVVNTMKLKRPALDFYGCDRERSGHSRRLALAEYLPCDENWILTANGAKNAKDQKLARD